MVNINLLSFKTQCSCTAVVRLTDHLMCSHFLILLCISAVQSSNKGFSRIPPSARMCCRQEKRLLQKDLCFCAALLFLCKKNVPEEHECALERKTGIEWAHRLSLRFSFSFSPFAPSVPPSTRARVQTCRNTSRSCLLPCTVDLLLMMK